MEFFPHLTWRWKLKREVCQMRFLFFVTYNLMSETYLFTLASYAIIFAINVVVCMPDIVALFHCRFVFVSVNEVLTVA